MSGNDINDKDVCSGYQKAYGSMDPLHMTSHSTSGGQIYICKFSNYVNFDKMLKY